MYLNWDFAITMLPLLIALGLCWGIAETLDKIGSGRRLFQVGSAALNGLAVVLLAIFGIAMAWQFVGPIVALFL